MRHDMATNSLAQPEEKGTESSIGAAENTICTIKYVAGGKDRSIKGKLLDLSATGVYFETRTELTNEQSVAVVLHVPSIRGEVRMDGWVTWCQPHRNSRWVASCRFEKQVSEEAIHELANSKIIDRRQDDRWPVDQKVTLLVELNSKPVTAQLINFSAGGYQIITPSNVKIKVGSRILLQQEGVSTIPTQVAWTREADTSTMAGCRFMSRQGTDAFFKVFANQKVDASGRYVKKRDLWLAVLVIAFLQVLSMLNTRMKQKQEPPNTTVQTEEALTPSGRSAPR